MNFKILQESLQEYPLDREEENLRSYQDIITFNHENYSKESFKKSLEVRKDLIKDLQKIVKHYENQLEI